MQREEEASTVPGGHLNMLPASAHGPHPNSHPPQPLDFDDEEDDEEYDEEDEYDDEDEEDEAVSRNSIARLHGRHAFNSLHY